MSYMCQIEFERRFLLLFSRLFQEELGTVFKLTGYLLLVRSNPILTLSIFFMTKRVPIKLFMATPSVRIKTFSSKLGAD